MIDELKTDVNTVAADDAESAVVPKETKPDVPGGTKPKPATAPKKKSKSVVPSKASKKKAVPMVAPAKAAPGDSISKPAKGAAKKPSNKAGKKATKKTAKKAAVKKAAVKKATKKAIKKAAVKKAMKVTKKSVKKVTAVHREDIFRPDSRLGVAYSALKDGKPHTKKEIATAINKRCGKVPWPHRIFGHLRARAAATGDFRLMEPKPGVYQMVIVRPLKKAS